MCACVLCAEDCHCHCQMKVIDNAVLSIHVLSCNSKRSPEPRNHPSNAKGARIGVASRV